MNQNNTLHRLLHSLLLGALALCSTTAFSQNRPVTQYFYDANGNLTSVVDGLNRVTTQNYDTLDRLRRITQPPPGAMQPNPVIQLERNGRDDLTRVIDPRNLATDYNVTGLSDITTQISPDTGLTTRTFDAAGNVLTSRDARGRTTTYTYDALHRLTRARYGDGTSSNYAYDQGANGIGRLTSMTDPGPITTSWTYTTMGRVATKTQTIGSGTSARTHQLAYSYNPTTGQLLSMTYPSGKLITYAYGAASKDLEAIAIDGAPVASGVTYHPFGGVKSFTLGNGQAWSSSLDQDGRLVTYTLGSVTHTVQWDAANRITAITSDQPSTDRSFGYDNLDRITGFATTGRSQSFVYDLTGNLLAKADVVSGTQTDYTFNIDPFSNRMTGIANLGIGYSFDAAGNRTGDGRITYAYNQRGRMNQVRIINGATTQTFNYLINGINLRVRKTGPSTVVPQGTRIFVYDDAAHLIGEYDNLGRARVEHVWLEDRPVAAITYNYSGAATTPSSTTVSYVETDHLATPRLITNASRQKRWSWEGAPYGDTLANENPQALGAYAYNLRFPGQYFDKETNHHYNHHRDYESTTGRYVQSDPIGLNGHINTYLYVAGNPARFADPSGLLFGVDAGESYGDYAAQYWANLHVQTGNPLYAIPGVLAALWTPCVSDSTFLSLVAPSAGAHALPAAARLLPNGVKGWIGETASIVSNWMRGNTLLGTQVRIPGMTTIADSAWRSANSVGYYIESKFGTSTLTAAQRLARDALGDIYHIERWGYDWVSRVGTTLGVGVGAGAAAGSCTCR